MGEKDAAMTLLQEEFQDDNIFAKKRATQRMDIVAKSLRPERTRKELIPWINDRIVGETQEADEILFMFAEQLVSLVDLVGGVEHAVVLIQPLQSLLGVDETFVRNAAVKAAVELFKKFSAEQILHEVVPMILSLAKNDWFTHKVSACALISQVAERVCKEKGSECSQVESLIEAYEKLCKDDAPMVRRAATKSLGSLAKCLKGEQVITHVLPLYKELVGDPQETVKLGAIEETCSICSVLSDKENVDCGLVDDVKRFMQDSSWRIRFSMATSFSSLAKAVGDDIAHNDLVPLFAELLRDPEGEVRSVAAKQVEPLLDVIKEETLLESLLPVITELVTIDSQVAVRSTLAQVSINPKFIDKVGAANVKASLLPIWEQFLKSENPGMPEVRLHVLRGLKSITSVLTSSFIVDANEGWGELIERIYHSSKSREPKSADVQSDEIEHPQWRLRQAILYAAEALADASSKDEQGNAAGNLDFVLRLWQAGLSDEVYQVRRTAADLLATFCSDSSKIGIQNVTELFIPKLLEFNEEAKGLKGFGGNYLHRIIFLHAAFGLHEHPEAWALVSKACLDALDDEVANVRLVACQRIAALGPETKESFIAKLSELCRDKDEDTALLAQKALDS